MAASGSFNTGSYKGSEVTRYLTFSWEEVSQSIENNTTTISWSLKGGGTSGYMVCGGFKVVIDGDTVYSKSTDYRIKVYNTTVIASGTKVITHNADGTRIFAASVQAGIYEVKVNKSGTGSFTLDKIARESSFTASPASPYLGDEITFSITPASADFRHSLTLTWDKDVIEIGSGITTQRRWTVSKDWVSKLPEDESKEVVITCITYSGSTEVGRKTLPMTLRVPAGTPTCNITVTDAAGVYETYNAYVKGLSKLTVTASGNAAQGSPIDTVFITVNGSKQTVSPATTNGQYSATVTTGVLTAAGTATISASVTDERGRGGTANSLSVNVLDYAAPVVSAVAVHRCDKNGDVNDRGEYVKVTFSASVYSLGGENSASYSLKYKKSSSATWTTMTQDANGKSISSLLNNYTPKDESFIISADGGSAYDISVTATDRHSTSLPKNISASTAYTLMNFGGNAIGFGKVAEKENTIQIAMDVEFLGAVAGTIFDAILPVGSMVLRYDHVDPGALYPGTVWEKLENTMLWATDAGVIGWISTKVATTTGTGLAVTQVSVWRRTA